jgi:hypothetical protein
VRRDRDPLRASAYSSRPPSPSPHPHHGLVIRSRPART